MFSFDEINLLPSLKKTLAEKSLKVPTEIQRRAMPVLLSGKSVVGVAQTGTGKTLAYALPLLHSLKTLENEGKATTNYGSPRAVIIVPTRDLGEQVARVFKLFTHETRLRVRSVLGGTSMPVAKKNLEGAFEILVATPGRILQLMDRKFVSFAEVRTLIFDEADQMLDPSFLPEAKRIAEACPKERQLGLFSATISLPVQSLINELFLSAEMIRCKDSQKLVSTLMVEKRFVKDGVRFPFLQKELKKPMQGGTLIFVNTRDQCDEVAKQLEKIGQPCVIYRGEMDKLVRRANLKAFRESKVNVLISTDLASRGLDVDHISRVINYHLPRSVENYIHRVGRTARAGRRGLVVNLVTPRDIPLMNVIEGG